MHREDESSYLLYIEPTKDQKSEEPTEDELTTLMEMALENSESGTASYSRLEDQGSFNPDNGYKGWHTTDCGEHSSNKDYKLENGLITNSLATFYLKWYRDAIPESEITKLKTLKKYYDEKG